MSEVSTNRLKQIIESDVFVTAEKQKIISASGRESNWLFDFRRILMQPAVLEEIAEHFLDRYKEKYPFQIGCLEVAGIPLATGLSFALYKKEYPVNAFFIRKSRKKRGLLNMVEGEVDNTKVILVDDIINSGKSFIRQVEVLESFGKKVDTVFSVLRFRDISFYEYFEKKGIKVESLFTLDDFRSTLGIKNLVTKETVPVSMPYSVQWYFKSENPNYFYVVPKSAPAIDEKKVFFGSDSGNFWALNQKDGSVSWKYKVGFHAKGKSIFSSPVIHNSMVYFGAYDGNFYALDSITGKRKWVFMEADWIGSSPCVSRKHNLIFIGLEFGLFTKKGGVAALDASTGKKMWEYTVPEFVHSSPAYSERFDMVICGSNNNSVYAFSAKKGKLLWELKTEGEVKESFCFDKKRKFVVFGSHDSFVYIVEIKTGKIVHKVKTECAIYSTPVIYEDMVLVSSLDKNIYAIDLDSGEIFWKFATGGRVFASPEVVGRRIIVGSNDGRLYELDVKTGENTALFQTNERITNKVVYNPKTRQLFVLTFANEMFCLTRQSDVE